LTALVSHGAVVLAMLGSAMLGSVMGGDRSQSSSVPRGSAIAFAKSAAVTSAWRSRNPWGLPQGLQIPGQVPPHVEQTSLIHLFLDHEPLLPSQQNQSLSQICLTHGSQFGSSAIPGEQSG
jgi:hypothetical protein